MEGLCLHGAGSGRLMSVLKVRVKVSTDDSSVAHSVFAGDSEMGALMRSFDWATTPLGPPES
jgi:hypothetical protein